MTAKLETCTKDHYDQSVKNKKSSNIIDVTKKSASKSFTKLRRRISIFSSSSSSSLSSLSSSSSSSSSPSPSSSSYSPPSHVSPLSSTGSFITSTKNSKFDFCYNNNKTSNNSMRIKGNKERRDIVIVGNNDDEDSTIFMQENLYHQEVLKDEDEYNDGGYMMNVVGGGEYNGKYYYYYDDNYVAIAKNQSDKRSSIQSIKLAVKQFAGVGKERRRHSEAYHQDGKTNPFE